MSDPIHHLRSQLALQITRDDLLHRFPGIISYLTRFYQDTMTVFVVSYFYIQKAKTTNQNQTLSEFLSSFTFERHLSPILYDHLQSHYAEISKLIQQVITAIPDPLDIKIVGDFHGASTTRLLITLSDGKQIIACANPYTSDNTIIDRYAHYRQD